MIKHYVNILNLEIEADDPETLEKIVSNIMTNLSSYHGIHTQLIGSDRPSEIDIVKEEFFPNQLEMREIRDA